MLSEIQTSMNRIMTNLLKRLYQFSAIVLGAICMFIGQTLYQQNQLPIIQSQVKASKQGPTSHNVPVSGEKLSKRTLHVYLAPNLPSNVHIGAIVAMSNWNQPNIVHLVQVDNAVDADIEVVPAQLHKDRYGMTLGLTHVSSINHQITHALVMIDLQHILKVSCYDSMAEAQANNGEQQVQTEINRVCEHEFGHALGLDHAKNNVPSVMRSDSSHEMTSYDIQALRQLYN